MKRVRSVKVARLMAKVIRSVVKGEQLQIKGNLKELDDLGGVYIKFLQIVVLNLDSSKQANFVDLLSVYDRSMPDPIDLKAYLRSMKYSQLSSFEYLEDTPFATGSFGQLYRGQLKTGEHVVMKILRPSVIKYLKYDLRLLRVLCSGYSMLDSDEMMDFMQIYREFRRTCFEEIDYRRECELGQIYYDTYQNHPEVVIPKTYPLLSNNIVLVQEYIDGLSMTKVLAVQAQGGSAQEYVREQIGSDLFHQLYRIGFELLSGAVTGRTIQADPHPGNLFLLPNNRVAIIDFGMSTRLAKHRGAFLRLLQQYKLYYKDDLSIEDFATTALAFLAPKLYEALRQADTIFKPAWDAVDQSSLIQKVQQKATRLGVEELGEDAMEEFVERKMLFKLLMRVINKGNRFGFSFDLSSMSLMKAIQSYLSLLSQFDTETSIIPRVVNDVVAYAEGHTDQVADDKIFSLTPQEALEVLSSWFDKMARRDPWLMNELTKGYN